MFANQPHQSPKIAIHDAEVEQFADERFLEFTFRLAQVRFSRRVACGSFAVRFNDQVGFYTGRVEP